MHYCIPTIYFCVVILHRAEFLCFESQDLEYSFLIINSRNLKSDFPCVTKMHVLGQQSSENLSMESPDTPPNRKSKTKSRKDFLCNLTSCKYEVVNECVTNFGFKLTQDPTQWILYWIDTGISVERLLEMFIV